MITKIKDKLKNNIDLIMNILKEINCNNIHKVNDRQLRFGFDDEGSGSGNRLYIDTLNFTSFSRDVQGDIITLVQDKLHITTGQSIRWLADKLGIKQNQMYFEVVKPFGGFWTNYDKTQSTDITPPLTYDKSILKQYDKGCSLLWIKDGISALTQERFEVGYDVVTNRITFPYYSEDGSLCGVIGRLNKTEIEAWECKYLSLVSVNKSKILFGLYQNYKDILNRGTLICVEAEKSVMKGQELNIPCVAVGKHDISPRQAMLIKSTFVKNVIICFDEGIDIDYCKKQVDRIKIKNPFFSNNIYIVNMDNPYIEKGSKVSLFDMDKDIIEKVMGEYLIKVE